MPLSQLFGGIVPLAMACALSAALNGQTATRDVHLDRGARKMMKSSDIAFAIHAAQGGLAEMKLGRLAAERGSSPDVKAFGQHMVDDHTQANERLKAVAHTEGMTLPTDVNGQQQAMYDRLSKLSGAEFDLSYVKGMVVDHKEHVKEFGKEAERGTDEEIKAFASQTLPLLQDHLDRIQSIQVNISNRSK